MSDDRRPLEERVDQLALQVRSLTAAVERLAGQLSDIQSRSPSRSRNFDDIESRDDDDLIEAASPVPPRAAFGGSTAVSDDLVSWAGRASVLTRISALCFLLVVALGLRTITDYGYIDKQMGLVIGMSYASLLMFAGWYLYRLPSSVAPVFAACGIVLMTAIVVETHAHFNSLSSASAYLLLTLTGIAMAIVSRQFNRFLPVSLGIMGMCLAGMVIDFPSPRFVSLALVLVVANVLGYSAARIRRCSWLRWTVLGITMGTLFIWAYELRFALLNRHEMLERLTPPYFLPVLAFVSLFYSAVSLLGIARSGQRRFSRFDLAVPTVNAAWAFPTAWYFAGALGGRRELLGAAGVVYAGALMAVAAWLAAKGRRYMSGAGAFTFAAVTLTAIAVPSAIGMLVALPLLSLAAFALIFVAQRWNSPTVRVASYLLQIYASACLSAHLWRNARFSVSPTSAMAAAAPALIGFLHYRWSRADRPIEEGERWQSTDHWPSFLLMASLISAFFMLRVGIYQALRLFPVDINNSFLGAQSVLINASAALLMLFAWLRRSREIRNVAILVTAIGAVKVFAYDLFGTHGMPLVISVFSFGLAAALESTALGRWGHRHDPAREDEDAAPDWLRRGKPAPAFEAPDIAAKHE